MTKHRADVRPRWGRVGASIAAFSVLLVALLATFGVLHGRPVRAVDPASDVARAVLQTAPTPTTDATPTDPPTPSSTADVDTDTALPPASGAGRRAVFSLSRQRVWIVDADDDVERTYLVSGSVTDNLHPGTYSVYSRSENAVGVDDSGTMKWFVRFAHGANAAIGFHDIPVKDGRPLQTLAQLGTPQSHGCIRQKEPDALAMWAFARIGTKVVVTV